MILFEKKPLYDDVKSMRKSISLIFLLFCLVQPVFLQEKSLERKKAQTDWTNSKVSLTVMESLPRVIIDTKDIEYGGDQTAYNVSEARNKALSKAKERSSLQIVKAVENIRLNDEYLILEKLNDDPSGKFRERFNQFFFEEKSELKVKFLRDKVAVESIIPFRGKSGLLNYLDVEYEREKFPDFKESRMKEVYTSLIVDARHLDFVPSLFPTIVTEKGIEIYSKDMVPSKYGIDKGIVQYHKDYKQAFLDSRAGNKPFFVLALTVAGKNRTSVSIPTEEAKKLFSSEETKGSLKKCNVIILMQD